MPRPGIEPTSVKLHLTGTFVGPALRTELHGSSAKSILLRYVKVLIIFLIFFPKNVVTMSKIAFILQLKYLVVNNANCNFKLTRNLLD